MPKRDEARELRESIRDSLWSELTARFPRRSIGRVEGMLDVWVGARRPTLAKRQRADGLFMPDIPSTPWLDVASFGFGAAMRRALPALEEEAARLLGKRAFDAYGRQYRYNDAPAENEEPALPPVRGWRQFTFLEHAAPKRAGLRRCPTAAALLEQIQRKAGLVSECNFLLFEPGTSLATHVDAMNFLVSVQMGVVVPRDCGLRVAGETRMHGIGVVHAFDNSFPHSAWNHGDGVRVLFSVHTVHPDLTRGEVRALAYLFPVLRDLSIRAA